MKKALRKNKSDFWYFDKKGHQVFGVAPPDVRGNLSDVRGDLTDVRGDLTGVCGDLSNVRGNLTGVCGDLTGVCGNLDDCEITAEDRKKGININTLIEEPAQ